ncbi:MAG: histidinol-phosphatase HisJ family protein [Oscillospiraceae bacterium]|nr:histidinol-phosphatase HisJ family protein [Oscillospiraceae bacterium]
MICDTHTHSMYSFDGVETIAAMCATAVSKGIQVLAVTDHTEVLTSKEMGDSERRRLREHREAVMEAQKLYAGKLKLLYACELGQPQFNPAWAEEMAQYPFDMVIGSIHFKKGDIDLYDVTYTRENRDECIHEYFEETKEMIRQGGFHTLGHLDYILRRMEGCFDGKPGYTIYREQVDEILSMLIERDIALEVNTAGLRKWLSALIEQWILERFRTLGGKYITIGSDAHVKEDIGAGFAEAAKLIRAAGFSEIVYFEKGQPVSVPLKGEV